MKKKGAMECWVCGRSVWRVLFAYTFGRDGRRAAQCIFAERRSVVCLLMEEILREKIVSEKSTE